MADHTATLTADQLANRAEWFQDRLRALRNELAKVFHGHRRLVEDLLTAVVAGGHVLLEGVPGLGKTVLARSVARCMDLKFGRIQFTPDLMPSDITGTNVLDAIAGKRAFHFEKGPSELLMLSRLARSPSSPRVARSAGCRVA
jgi:MoxR-like ATPase